MSEHLALVTNFNNPTNDLKTIKLYEGLINQNLVKDIAEEIESTLNESSNNVKTNKRVFNVTVELLQNICKHAENAEGNVKEKNVGYGIFALVTDGSKYYVKTGNFAKTGEAKSVIERINEFNVLSADEVKARYKDLIKASRISEKGGAGLGMIDIIKKTKNKIECKLELETTDFSYFIQQATVDIV